MVAIFLQAKAKWWITKSPDLLPPKNTPRIRGPTENCTGEKFWLLRRGFFFLCARYFRKVETFGSRLYSPFQRPQTTQESADSVQGVVEDLQHLQATLYAHTIVHSWFGTDLRQSLLQLPECSPRHHWLPRRLHHGNICELVFPLLSQLQRLLDPLAGVILGAALDALQDGGGRQLGVSADANVDGLGQAQAAGVDINLAKREMKQNVLCVFVHQYIARGTNI